MDINEETDHYINFNCKVSTDSTIDLIDKLSIRLAKNFLDSQFTQYSSIRKEFIDNAKKTIWNSLLSKRLNKRNDLQTKKLKCNGINRMYFYTFELSKLNQRRKSSRIQDLIERLHELNEDCFDILEFIVNFKTDEAFAPVTDYKNIDYLKEKISSFALHEKIISNKIDIPFDFLEKFDSLDDKTSNEWVISKVGTNDLFLKPDNKFMRLFNLNRSNENLDKVQKMSKDTLFSALISKTTGQNHGVDLNLDIPDLPEDRDLFRWQIPKTATYEWIDYKSIDSFNISKNLDSLDDFDCDDEGFCSDKCSPIVASNRSGIDWNKQIIWDNALKYSISEYIDWDMKEDHSLFIPGLVENERNIKKLLIDSSSYIFDQFYYNYLSTIDLIIDKSDFKNKRVLIEETQFIVDCLNVLISLFSKSFIWKEDSFVFNKSLHISGISSESLDSYSQEYAQTGTYHKYLLNYIQIPERNVECGSVFRSFINAIKSYLKCYNEEIISFLNKRSTLTIISLYSQFKLKMDQIKFLAEVCDYDSNKTNSRRNFTYLKGIDLIFRLYKILKSINHNSLNYPLTLYLLFKVLVPFFKFIETWIFEGEYFDPHNEFIIDYNFDYINSRDRNYFLKVFKLKERFQLGNISNQDEYVLKDLYYDIFNCGKSLALLRICDPKHFLCNNKRFHPKLTVNFNLSYLKNVTNICEDYKLFIIQNASDVLKSRKEIKEETLKKNQENMKRMLQESAERFKQYKEIENEKKKAEQERKQNELDFLKAQMEDDLKRRGEEKQKQKQEDKEYLEKLVNRNSELTEKQKQIEQELKKEIIEEYEQLTKQAEAREAAALSKIEKLTNEIAQITDSSIQNQLTAQNESQNEQMDYEVSEDIQKSILPIVDAESSQTKNNQTQLNDDDTEMMEIEHVQMEDEKVTKTTQSNEPMIDKVVKLSVNDQTQEKEYKPSIKIQKDKNALSESPSVEFKSKIKINKELHHSNETNFEAIELNEQKRLEAFKKRNLHGHSSDSQIKNILYNTGEVEDEKVVNRNTKLQNKIFSNEAKNVDVKKALPPKFNRNKNQAEKIINDDDYDEDENQIDIDERVKNEKFLFFTQKDNRVNSINFDEIIKPYNTNFNELFEQPISNSLLSNDLLKKVRFNLNSIESFIESRSNNYLYMKSLGKNLEEFYKNDVDECAIENELMKSKSSNETLNQLFSYNYIEIDEILNRILFKPIQLQCELVNKCLVNYFLFNLDLEEHLSALRKYVLFENGEFAQTFVDQLCDSFFSINFFNTSRECDSSINMEHFLSPIYINESLNKAKSQVKNCKYIDNISIRINYDKINSLNSTKKSSSTTIDRYDNILRFLSCLELKYKLNWPLNIIISDACIKSYNQIFGFLLQIKFVIAALNNVWHTLKRYAILYNYANSYQLKQLKLYCHEMQHYLSALQNYISNQVIQVTWEELQKKLNDIETIEELIEVHALYVKNAMSRCFFTKKAESVFSVIQAIFQKILKFRAQLVSDMLIENKKTHLFEHKCYESLSMTYTEFKVSASFLYKGKSLFLQLPSSFPLLTNAIATVRKEVKNSAFN